MSHPARSLMAALLLATLPLTAPVAHAALFGIGISVHIAPPPLPVYVQPACPGPGYLWTPGYWAWGHGEYYWVPGTWVRPPRFGLLWTPGYWGWSGGVYVWHPGYWGRHVGFYGGVNYGYGYNGHGFVGGHWHGHEFYYNRAYANVRGGRFHVYSRLGPRFAVSRVSFNGGRGGIVAHPTAFEMRAGHQRAGFHEVALHRPAMRRAAPHRGPARRPQAHGGHGGGHGGDKHHQRGH